MLATALLGLLNHEFGEEQVAHDLFIEHSVYLVDERLFHLGFRNRIRQLM